jgi:hypothetical protein
MSGAVPIILLVLFGAWLAWDARRCRQAQQKLDAGWDAIHARGAQPCPDCGHPCRRHWDGCGDCGCQVERRALFAGCI